MKNTGNLIKGTREKFEGSGKAQENFVFTIDEYDTELKRLIDSGMNEKAAGIAAFFELCDKQNVQQNATL